jgi:hypothetical protein
MKRFEEPPAIVEQVKQSKFICSACGGARDCDCTAPAVERLAKIREQTRQRTNKAREKAKQNQRPCSATPPPEVVGREVQASTTGHFAGHLGCDGKLYPMAKSVEQQLVEVLDAVAQSSDAVVQSSGPNSVNAVIAHGNAVIAHRIATGHQIINDQIENLEARLPGKFIEQCLDANHRLIAETVHKLRELDAARLPAFFAQLKIQLEDFRKACGA